MEAAQLSDDLADTVGLRGAGPGRGRSGGRRSYRLLEALAGRLASALLIVRPRLEAVEVTVRKLRRRWPSTWARPGSGCGAPADGRTGRATVACLHRAGSNLGDRRALLRRAVAGSRTGGDVVGVSPLYESETGGRPAGQDPTSTWWWSCRRRTLPGSCSSAAGPSRRRRSRVRTVRWGLGPLRRRRPVGRGVASRRGGPHRPAPPLVGTALRGAAAGGRAPDFVTSQQLRASGGKVAAVGNL